MAGASSTGDGLNASRQSETGPALRGPARFVRRPVAALTVALAVLLPACGNGALELDAEDDGTSVTLAVGEEIRLSLGSNPSTGYGWHLRDELDEDILRVQSSEYVPDEGSEDLAGGGGTEIWVFRATGPGSVAVALVYSFGDETEDEANDFSFSVTVER